MKIYTRAGDTGDTGLLGGGRVSKTSLRMVAIGEVDELNAHLGVASVMAQDTSLAGELIYLQARLFDLGAELAAASGTAYDRPYITDVHTTWLEEAIDRHTDALPPLKYFILPGGTSLAAQLHLTRAVSRRAERAVLDFHAESAVRPATLTFLNRLSDYLFTIARTANHSVNVRDTEWHPEP